MIKRVDNMSNSSKPCDIENRRTTRWFSKKQTDACEKAAEQTSCGTTKLNKPDEAAIAVDEGIHSSDSSSGMEEDTTDYSMEEEEDIESTMRRGRKRKKKYFRKNKTVREMYASTKKKKLVTVRDHFDVLNMKMNIGMDMGGIHPVDYMNKHVSIDKIFKKTIHYELVGTLDEINRRVCEEKGSIIIPFDEKMLYWLGVCMGMQNRKGRHIAQDKSYDVSNDKELYERLHEYATTARTLSMKAKIVGYSSNFEGSPICVQMDGFVKTETKNSEECNFVIYNTGGIMQSVDHKLEPMETPNPEKENSRQFLMLLSKEKLNKIFVELSNTKKISIMNLKDNPLAKALRTFLVNNNVKDAKNVLTTECYDDLHERYEFMTPKMLDFRKAIKKERTMLKKWPKMGLVLCHQCTEKGEWVTPNRSIHNIDKQRKVKIYVKVQHEFHIIS